MRAVSVAVMAVALMTAPSALASEAPSQAALDRLADTIGYRVTVVDNHPTCPEKVGACFLSTITLTLPDKLPQGLGTDGLSLYFSYVNQLPLVESDIFEHRHINGDVQRLTLKPGVKLRPGAKHVVKLWGVGAQFSIERSMPNAYLVSDGLKPRTIAATRVVIDPDTGLDNIPFVDPFKDEARLATKGGADKMRWLTAERAFEQQADRAAPKAAGVVILPKPIKASQGSGKPIDLTGGYTLTLSGVAREAIAPALTALAGSGVGEGGALPLTIRVGSPSLAAEAYALDVTPRGILIEARDAAGASHALRSLTQQATFERGRLRPLRVEDAPLYGFRGLHVDVGRNFHSRDQLLKIVEAMAAYKMNRLHLHLADDEGWRIEIPGLPELTDIGSKRCHDLGETRCLLPQLGAGPDGEGGADGYLSVADYVAIVKAATARQIEVIPSIDTPGHSRAAVRSMEARYARLSKEGKKKAAEEFRLIDPADTTVYSSIQYYNDNTLNVCISSSYHFVDTVVDALAAMHRQAGAPLKTFHLGADETAGAWVNSPACKAMIAENGGDARELTPRFIERVANSLAAKGIRTGGWSDGMGHADPARMPKDVHTNIWTVLHSGAIRETHDQLNRGWQVVLSIPDLGYLDMPYAPHPEEGGYDWAARVVNEHQIYGFMTENLPANAATMRTIFAEEKSIEDQPVRQDGRRIAGIQGQLWSETIRTDRRVDYMLFPRLLALAERAWSPAPWTPTYRAGESYAWKDKRVDHAALNEGWRNFAGRVATQWPLLERMGIDYRVAPPGARVANGKLEANSVFPGTAIEYRPVGGAWMPYTAPVAIRGPVEVRSRSGDGKRASRAVRVEPAQ
ncbi:MAG: family 20 glycosylhydrolase [Sphingopyxis sp.]|uniref:family 20 glycosylhydrolase n=1 Tax=Sphingopyxis sp. TaxID=1908224 RepID=UPI002ABCF22F|nr:family 20 glycosylhydrolase [Sphingopyxis sp.]MDZ3832965.1 family 20 glycosylhydrolase [Sphingopyxis sp.]